MTEINVIEDLSQLKKLVKINRDLAEFTADVSITSEDGKDFMFQFFSQKDLDASKKIEYDVGNNISTTISVEGKPYDSYYILLKTDNDNPVRVKVSIVLNPIITRNDNNRTNLDTKNNLQNDTETKHNMDEMTRRRLSDDENNRQDVLDRLNKDDNMMSGFITNYSLQIGLGFLLIMIIIIARSKV